MRKDRSVLSSGSETLKGKFPLRDNSPLAVKLFREKTVLIGGTILSYGEDVIWLIDYDHGISEN